METDILDDVDRQLVHALVAAPRAPFTLLADVIGVSDQTVARRYRRLAENAGLRVYGIVNGERAGWVDWMVRLQVTPGSADAIAEALARRPDTRWVRLFSGGTEIVCTLQARTLQQRDDLFLRGLPGSRRVVQITAHSILHVFSPVQWSGFAGRLSDAQLARLGAAGAANPDQPRHEAAPGAPGNGDAAPLRSEETLRPEDNLLLAELARDGRASHAALAAATHWHESTVRRRIEELQHQGLLYFDVDMNDAFLGMRAGAMLWLAVAPGHLEAAGQAVAAHPEVPFAAATTGPTNLVVSAAFRDTRHLYEYLTTRLTGLPGIQTVETLPIIGTVKRTGLAGPWSSR
ncbi:MAG: Lrp/AsnC family transcriptional regulator [Actinomycetia bacterium]|nr:Lrp/AsnC family transcriptional regulator [Actinomycetes bacterium]